MVMSVAFIEQLQHAYPAAQISVIAKKGIHELLPYFPSLRHRFIFSKAEHKGLSGLWRFGRSIQKAEKFDLFFCLPDSFSSALMGFATGAKKRIGFTKELRNFLLTNAYSKPKNLHRVDEYVALLECYRKEKASPITVRLHHSFARKEHIVVNINSEATSRRLTVSKAVEEIDLLRKNTAATIYLIGAPKERDFVSQVFSKLHTQVNIVNAAGSTPLPQLVELLASACLMLTTDSGPAHLANALGTHTVVLFGAGNESNTAPYNKELHTVIRLGKLPCEPCLKNKCVLYEVPQCLQQLSTDFIIDKTLQQLHKNG